MPEWAPSLKPIAKYMKRAHEVETANPIVAYYCNFYSLRRALELRDQTDEAANRFVTGLLEKCNDAKAAIGPDDGSHRGIVEEFAFNVFEQADTEDREGRATRDTSLTFYAAMCFIEVCSVFSPLTSDLDERARYARWKAADILKALREGRKPTPGPPCSSAGGDHGKPTPTLQLPPLPLPPTQSSSTSEGLSANRGMEHHATTPSSDTSPIPPTYNNNSNNNHAALPPPTSTSSANDSAPTRDVIPPAPEVREYDSDLHDYEPSADPVQPDAFAYPPAAPPYPSSEAPSPHHASSSPVDPPSSSHPYPAPLPPPAYPTDPTSPYSSKAGYDNNGGGGGGGGGGGAPPPSASHPQYGPPISDGIPPAYSTPPGDAVLPHSVPLLLPPPPAMSQGAHAAMPPPPPHHQAYAPPNGGVPPSVSMGAPQHLHEHFASAMHLSAHDGGRLPPGTPAMSVALPPNLYGHPAGAQPPPPQSHVVDAHFQHVASTPMMSHLGVGPGVGVSPMQLPPHVQAPPPPAYPHAVPQHMQQQQQQQQVVAQQQVAQQHMMVKARPSPPVPNFVPNVSSIREAQRYARHAVSALDFQDVNAARLNLEKALQLITGQ